MACSCLPPLYTFDTGCIIAKCCVGYSPQYVYLFSSDMTDTWLIYVLADSPAPSLLLQAILMEFRRSSTGFLGFTINEAGVVERVDGLAKTSGLHPNSRLLQVRTYVYNYV